MIVKVLVSVCLYHHKKKKKKKSHGMSYRCVSLFSYKLLERERERERDVEVELMLKVCVE